jgi:hypothetical protein
LVSFFHTTSFRDIEDNFVGKREIAAAALTVCATLLLYLVQYELGSEGPFSSSAYILNCNSTTKKEKKNRQKIIAGTAAAALELLYLSQSQKVEQPKKSFVFLFNFFI